MESPKEPVNGDRGSPGFTAGLDRTEAKVIPEC